jgi:hypothetical protein
MTQAVAETEATIQDLQERLDRVEGEVGALKKDSDERKSQWGWLKVVGAYADDPVFDEIAALGREYRECESPAGNESEDET